MDVGGKYAGSVSGTMNLMGNLAGVTSTMVGGYLLTQTGNDWNLFITILASVYFLGIGCWPFITPDRPIEEHFSRQRSKVKSQKSGQTAHA
jgi:hypothetical protein